MHETPSTKFFFQRSFLHRWMWNQAHKIIFFTDKERLNFINSYNFGVINNTFVELVNTNFIKFTNRSPLESSLHLNLPLTNKIRLLCIGFIQKNKGYDRVIRLFNKNNYNNLELYITGSAKVDDNQSVEYLNSLIELKKSKNIFITSSYISNQDFDDWINSCNYLLLPYVEIFNSGVLGRAKLFDKISILSNVGGLADQSNHRDLIFNSDNELEEILFKINRLCIK